MSNHQLLLDIDIKIEQKGDFIVSSCNIEAYKAIHDNIFQNLIVIGPKYSGKTFLTSLFIGNNNGILIKKMPTEQDLKYSAWAVDNIDEFNNDNILFHIINLARENSILLLMTAKMLPKFELKDLQSRILSIQKILIKRPDESFLMELMRKGFKDRQLKVKEEVIQFLSTRTQRNFEVVDQFISEIDKLSLLEKRNITVPLVKKLIEAKFGENIEK